MRVEAVRIITIILFVAMLAGCASPLPSNYLSPLSVRASQPVNGKLVSPRFIPISPAMLDSPEGRYLLAPAMRPQPYRIGAFDNLNVIVWGHPEVSTVATTSSVNQPIANGAPQNLTVNPALVVQSDGTIFYPFVGQMKVAGLTVTEIQRRIAARLSKYIRNPQVTVQVAKFRNRNVYVLGEVKNPTMLPITDKPLSLMEAITLAGSIDPSAADPSHIYLIRGLYQKPDVFWLKAKTPQSLIIAGQFPLQENDIIFVSSAALTDFNRMLNQILPPLTSYTIVEKLSK